MNRAFFFTLIATAFVAFVSASKEFRLTKKRIPASKYERRCEDDDSNLASLNLDGDNLKSIAKFLRSKHVHEAWIGSVDGIDYKGATLMKVFFDRDGKYDFHTFEVVPQGHAMKFAGEHYAICARK